MEPEKKLYPVLSPLRHNGGHYAPAEDEIVAVLLDETEAEELARLGVVGTETVSEEDVKKSKAKKKPAKK